MEMLREAVRYGLVGVSATVVDWGLYYALTRGVPALSGRYVLAGVLSFSVAVVWAYLMHRRFTFRVRHGRHRQQFPKFLTITLTGLALHSVLLWVGIERLGLYDLYAKVLASGIGALWNYAGQRFWTFRPSGPYTAPESPA